MAQLLQRQTLVDNDRIGHGAPLLAARLLRNDALDRFGRPAIALPDALDLRWDRAIDDEHPVHALPPVPRLSQQGNVEDDAAAWVSVPGSAGLGQRLALDHRVQDGLQSTALGHVAEDARAHPVAVEGSVGAEDVNAESPRQRGQRGSAWSGQRSRDGVGVDERSTLLHQHPRHGALAAADTARQADPQARRDRALAWVRPPRLARLGPQGGVYRQPIHASTVGNPVNSTARPPPARKGPKGT